MGRARNLRLGGIFVRPRATAEYGGGIMRAWSKAFFQLVLLASAICFGAGTAQAQYMKLVGAATVAIKSGETLDLGEIYWVLNCRSLLKATPEVEVLDGPPQVSVNIREAMVLPRFQNCPNKVAGGMLSITAKEIDDPSFTRLTLRVLYRTKDGDRKYSRVVNLQLVP